MHFSNRNLPPQTTNVHKGTLDSNSLHRQAELWNQECYFNNSWEQGNHLSSRRPPHLLPPPSHLKSHCHHLLRQESLMGFRGKYRTKVLDGPTTDCLPLILFPGCYVT